MKTINTTGVGLVTSALTLVAWPATSVLAQGVVGPQASGSSSGAAQSGSVTTAVVVASLLAVLVVLGALIKMLDLKRKRETEAVVVQARISDAVLRDPRLFSLPITPTAHVPLWKGTPVTVEVAGQVPSDDLREAAVGLIEREAAQMGSEVRVESRIGVVPTMARRSA
ncbi:MAG TPA: hypothetical protein VKG20_12780 [Methylomirabilota bacterium]|nr:hypothetical protein [Methylomirabilota bacterium]